MQLTKETKSGVVTSEFWLVIVVNALTQIGALDVPERYKWIVLAASIAAYSISRGLAKLGVPEQPTIGGTTVNAGVANVSEGQSIAEAADDLRRAESDRA